MKYHILGEHPQLGRILSGPYPLGPAQRNQAKWAGRAPEWTYLVVRCLAPHSFGCGCAHDDTFEVVPDD